MDRIISVVGRDLKEKTLDQLTPTEFQVLRLIGQGKSNDEIAELMFISKNTVRSHIKSIYAKLDTHSRLQLALYAINSGFVLKAGIEDAMTKKVAPARKPSPFPDDLEINRRREWRFDFPLDTLIEAASPTATNSRKKRASRTSPPAELYFTLDSGVVVGSKLNLFIELPEKLADGKKLKLRIGGITVRLEKPDKKTKRQGVAVRFSDDLFKVVPN